MIELIYTNQSEINKLEALAVEHLELQEHEAAQALTDRIGQLQRQDFKLYRQQTNAAKSKL